MFKSNHYYCNSFEYRTFRDKVLDGLSMFGVPVNEELLETIQDYFLHTSKPVEKVILEIVEVLKDEDTPIQRSVPTLKGKPKGNNLSR